MEQVKIRLFFFLLTFSICFKAQDDGLHPEVQEMMDSLAVIDDLIAGDSAVYQNVITENAVTKRKYSPGFTRKYKGSDFDYERKLPTKSIWQRLKEKIINALRALFGDVEVMKFNNLTMVALRVFGAVLIAFLLYLLAKYLMAKDGRWFFAKSKGTAIAAEYFKENIHELDFQHEILQAESSGNYRLAVRYLFLKQLKELTDKKIIEWNPEKTNRDYIAEIKDANKQADYLKTARIFDYVWYGEFAVSQSLYAKFREVFEQQRF